MMAAFGGSNTSNVGLPMEAAMIISGAPSTVPFDKTISPCFLSSPLKWTFCLCLTESTLMVAILSSMVMSS